MIVPDLLQIYQVMLYSEVIEKEAALAKKMVVLNKLSND